MEKIGKRGMEAWVLAGLLIALVVAFVLIVFTGGFAVWIGEQQAQSSCQTWVDTQSSRLGTPVFGIKVIDYTSPCQTVVESIKVDTQEELDRAIADRQLGCLASYRFGKENFYSEYKLSWSKTYCRFCNEMYIDKESKVKQIDWEAYQIFINTQKPKYSTKTYAELFTDTEDASLDFGGIDKTDIDYGKPLYIAFMVDDSTTWGEKIAVFGEAALGIKLYQSYKDVKAAGGVVKGIKVVVKDLAFIKRSKSIGPIPGIVTEPRSYGSAFGGVVKSLKGNLYVTLITSTAVAATYSAFKPGVGLMTGEQVLENSDCDMGVAYMNPVIKDKELESKLAEYRKEKSIA